MKGKRPPLLPANIQAENIIFSYVSSQTYDFF